MTITFPCIGCGKQYKATAESAGKQIKCTDCGTIVRIPIPRTVAAPAPARTADEVTCPSCHATCGVLPEWRGKKLECPTCHQRFTVPALGGPAGASIPTARPVPAFHTDDTNAATSSPLFGLDEPDAANDADDDYSTRGPIRRRTVSELPAWVSSPGFWVTAGGVVVAIVVILAVLLGPVRRAVTDMADDFSKAAQPLPPWERWVSTNSVAMIRVAELTDGRLDSFGASKQEILDIPVETLSNGLQLSDVELLYVDRPSSHMRVAILKRPVKVDRGSVGAEVFETYKEFTIFETPDGDFRFYPHPRMVVQSDDLEWIEFKLDYGKWPLAASSLEFPRDCQLAIRSGGYASASFDSFAFNQPMFSGFGRPGGFRRPLSTRGRLFGFSFASGRVDARMHVEFQNAADAAEYKSRYETGAAELRSRLNQRSPQANQDAAGERMLNAILAGSITADGQVANVWFSFSAADMLQLTGQGTISQGPPGRNKSKTPADPSVTVRVTGVVGGTDGPAINERIRTLVGGTNSYSLSSTTDTLIAWVKTTVSPQELAKRIDFGEVKRVKGRGIHVVGDPKRIAALPKPTDPRTATASEPKDDQPSRRSASSDKPDSKALLEDLDSSSVFTRRDAVKALIKMKPDENQPAIARRLESLLPDADIWFVEDVLDALAIWGDKDSTRAVVRVLKQTRWSTTKTKALTVLANFPDESAVDAIVGCMEEYHQPPDDVYGILKKWPQGDKIALQLLRNDEARAPVLRDAAQYIHDCALKAPPSPEMVTSLLEIVRKVSDRDTLKPLVAVLATVKEERVASVLVTGLADSRYVRDAKAAMIAMGPVAEPAVRKYLKHQDPAVRLVCCEILAEIGTTASVSSLRSLVANNPVGLAARAAVNAINERAKTEN